MQRVKFGFEPKLKGHEPRVLPLHYLTKIERVRIELTFVTAKKCRHTIKPSFKKMNKARIELAFKKLNHVTNGCPTIERPVQVNSRGLVLETKIHQLVTLTP